MELADLRRSLELGREVRLKVKVVPKSSRSEIAGFMGDGTLKLKVQAPPERGKANAQVCSVLAAAFGVPERNVSIVSGETSPLKQVVVSAPSDLRRRRAPG
jgi:uncharacterized protein